jgi:hypothetical protein
VDFNNDGLKDIVAGDTKGNVWYFKNVGAKGKPELATGEMLKADGKVIAPAHTTYKMGDKGAREVDQVMEGSHELAGVYSKIHLADWDDDGLMDLLIGHMSTIVFYKNAGTKSAPSFLAPKLIVIPEGKFPDRPSPYVVDWDGDGKLDLLSGCERPKITFYRNVGSNGTPKLEKGVEILLKAEGFDKGYRCRIGIADWNNDGKMDLLVGNRVIQEKPSTGGNIWLFLGK